MTNIKARRESPGYGKRGNRSLKASNINVNLFDAFSVGTFIEQLPGDARRALMLVIFDDKNDSFWRKFSARRMQTVARPKAAGAN